MKRYFTDRSRTIDGFRCARLRYWSYEHDGRGIEPARKPLPLCVGSAVHKGLEYLLRVGGADWNANGTLTQPATLEDAAVAAALADFAEESAGGLELDLGETTAMAAPVPTLASSLVDSAFEFGLATDTPELVALQEDVAGAGKRFDAYLAKEQASLVEGMVRAYARRRLRPLLEQFQVLEVEREGEWRLATFPVHSPTLGERHSEDECAEFCDSAELWFMSRPDALLLERESRELYLLSYKTAASWDQRKQLDAQHDMQGLTEGIEVEQRLAGWWQAFQDGERPHDDDGVIEGPMLRYLESLSAPPRIHAVRMEFLLKQERRKDKVLTEEMGFECRSQASPLVRAYMNRGMVQGDEQFAAMYDFVKPDGATSNLYYKDWRPEPVWKHMTIKQWIDKLADCREVQTALGGVAWECAGQAKGLLKEHPLDSQFISPLVTYRNDDDLRDLVESLEAVEVRNAQNAEAVRAATDDSDRRHLLNVLWPMNRSACVWPSCCKFEKLCFGSDDLRQRPLEAGLYRVRQPNHPQEVVLDPNTNK